MNYYKFLDLDYLSVSQFFRKYCKENRQNLNYFWNNVNKKELLDKCPEIQLMFNQLNIRIANISIIATSNSDINEGIHKDNTPLKTRINIPIYNCENSVTNFYTSEKLPEFFCLDNGIPYSKISRSDCVLVDTMSLTKPSALNVHALHQVVVNNPGIIRLSATISFYENIDHLLD